MPQEKTSSPFIPKISKAEQKIYADVYDVLLGGMLLSTVLFAAGVVLALIHPHYIPLTHDYVERNYHFSQVVHGLLALRPGPIMLIATLLLILTPVSRVLISIYAFYEPGLQICRCHRFGFPCHRADCRAGFAGPAISVLILCDATDLCSHPQEFLFDSLISPINVIDPVNHRLTGGGEAGQHQRGAGAKVGGLYGRAAQTSFAAHHRAPTFHNNIRAHTHEF